MNKIKIVKLEIAAMPSTIHRIKNDGGMWILPECIVGIK